MAKILYDLLCTDSQADKRNCNGLTDSSTLQTADDPKLIFYTRTGSVQDGLRN